MNMWWINFNELMDLSPQDFVANARCSLFFRLINAWKYIDKTHAAIIFHKCNLINNVNVILFRLRCMVIFSHQRHIVTFLFFFHSPNGLNNVLYISSCTCKNNKQKRLKHDGISLQFWFKPSLFVVWHHPYRPKKKLPVKTKIKTWRHRLSPFLLEVGSLTHLCCILCQKRPQ